MEYVVATGAPKRNRRGLPSHYKLDLALDKKLAVEIDGASHLSSAVKKADEKKDLFLRSCGWCVLRFQNARVLTDPKGVLKEIKVALRSIT